MRVAITVPRGSQTQDFQVISLSQANTIYLSLDKTVNGPKGQQCSLVVADSETQQSLQNKP